MRRTRIEKMTSSMLEGMDRFFAHDSRGRQAAMPITRQCGECGGKVLSEWRLCPHCGFGLTPGDGTGAEGTR